MRFRTTFVSALASAGLLFAALPANAAKSDLSFGYVAPTPACGSTIHINPGETVEFDITLVDSDPTHVIAWVAVDQPAGSTFTPGSPIVVFGNGVDIPTITTHFSWTPAADQTGSFQVVWDSANFPDAIRLPCSVTIEIASGPFCSYTQGGWGARPNGNNPGTLLKNNFATVYPSGVEIGIPGAGGRSAKFTTAKAIENFLPAGSTPGVLSGDFVNPTGATGAGVFAGQVLALQLNVDFSAAGLPSGSGGPIGDLKFTNTGIPGLDGQTVSQFLAAANNTLGGGGASYGLSTSDLNDLVTNINEGFDECHATGWANQHLE